jgi:hypothetical protein
MRNLYTYFIEASENSQEQANLRWRFKDKYDSLYKKISHTLTPKHSTLVISMCGAEKNPDSKKEKVFARDMYMGPANTILKESLPNLPVDWVILSGGYGTMNQTSRINYYTDVIMDLTKENLHDMMDYLKYNSDIKKIIEKGNYKRIIFVISDRWMYTLNLKELGDTAGKGCEIITFLTPDRLNDDDFEKPDNMINIEIQKSYLKIFGAPMIAIKEKITSLYLEYIHKNSDIDIREFIRRYKS